jgi:BolA protein
MSALTYTIADIHQHLQTHFPDGQLQVINESADHEGHAGNPGGGAISHIRVRLRTPSFAALRIVAQHRAIHAALDLFYKQGLHAVVLDTGAA